MSKNWPKNDRKNFPESWHNTCEGPEAEISKFPKFKGQCGESIQSKGENGRGTMLSETNKLQSDILFIILPIFKNNTKYYIWIQI